MNAAAGKPGRLTRLGSHSGFTWCAIDLCSKLRRMEQKRKEMSRCESSLSTGGDVSLCGKRGDRFPWR